MNRCVRGLAWFAALCMAFCTGIGSARADNSAHQRGFSRLYDGNSAIDGVRANVYTSSIDLSGTPDSCVLFDVVENTANNVSYPVQVETGALKCAPNEGGIDQGGGGSCGAGGNLIAYSEKVWRGNDGYFHAQCVDAGLIAHGNHLYAARQEDGTGNLLGVVDNNLQLTQQGFDTNKGNGYVWGELLNDSNCADNYSGGADFTNILRYQADPGGGQWYTLANGADFTYNSTGGTNTCYFTTGTYSSSDTNIYH